MSEAEPILSAELTERVLQKLGLNAAPDPTLNSLRRLYALWGRAVPFDNVRKLIDMASGSTAPLPGTTADDFFRHWLQHGTGGTCWAGAGALSTLLRTLGFTVDRGIATMLVAPDLPPNHGTVIVTFDEGRFLVDSSILHGEPLPLIEGGEAEIEHPAWGVRCAWRDGRWHIAWRPLHKLDGFECRIERLSAEQSEYTERYEATRGWSPFNYELSARINRDGRVVGAAFGRGVVLLGDGSILAEPFSEAQRRERLIEDMGFSEEIVDQLPPDSPTPPPPGSQTAARNG